MPNISYFMQNFLNQASCSMKRKGASCSVKLKGAFVLQHEARRHPDCRAWPGRMRSVIFSHKNYPIFLVFSLFCVIV